jgi:hypothetical protein
MRAATEEVHIRIATGLGIFALLCVGLALAQTNASPTAPGLEPATISAGETMVTGCLKGSTEGYYLIEKNGTVRLLMDYNQDLWAYAGDWVKVGGNRDLRRDASACNDQGTPHGLRFFQVEKISRRPWGVRALG